MQLTLAHLYPDLMNIYGDRGNLQTLVYRCQKQGIKLTVKPVGLKDSLTSGSFDLLFAGGGQDQQQAVIAPDLQRRASLIKKASQAGIPMLVICGSYQLFGRYFKPFQGQTLKGLGIFNAYTVAGRKRKIGNILITTALGKLVGFENHSGNTWLQESTQPLGRVISGFGNNGQDKTEGAVVNNVFGCYLHGSLLPKNPHFADHLIALALKTKYHRPIKLKPLDDSLEWLAHHAAINRTKKLAHPLLKYL